MTVLQAAAQEFGYAAAGHRFRFSSAHRKGRALFDELQSGNVTRPEADVRDLEIVGDPRGTIPVRIAQSGHAFGQSGRAAAAMAPERSANPEARVEPRL